MSNRQPRVTGISPLQGTPGTKITVRGENFGKNVTDLISISISGVDCTLSAEWVSPSKITVRPGLCDGEGDIVVTTKSGGRGISLVKFLCYIQDKVGLLEDSGIFLDEDEASSTLIESDILNILPDSYPTIPNDLCNVNLSEFNPEVYVSLIYAAVPFDSLKTGLKVLEAQIRPHDQEPLELVKKSLSLHFDAYRKLDDLKIILDKEKRFGINLNCIDYLYESVLECFSTLLSRQDQVERNRQLITHFNRWRNLFTLPSSMERNISRGNFQEAIDDYDKAVESQNRSECMPKVVELIYSHSEKKIRKLRDKLKESLLDDDGMNLREQSQALMIAQNSHLVKQFIGVRFGKIKDKLVINDKSDCIKSLHDISLTMSKFFPDFVSLCDFCKSINFEEEIEEYTDLMKSSLVKLYSQLTKDLLPNVEKISDSSQLISLELALHCHRKCALTVFTGNERRALGRVSRTARFSCMNAYFNCYHRDAEALLTDYTSSVTNNLDDFPAQFYDLIQSCVERLDKNVTGKIQGELDFFDCQSSKITFLKRFNLLIGVYNRGLKSFLRAEIELGSSSWLKLALFLVDVEYFVGNAKKKFSLILQSYPFTKVDDIVSDFVNSCLRRSDDLLKRLVKIKTECGILSSDSMNLCGISSHVFCAVNKVVLICSEISLISTSLLRKVLLHVCDNFLEEFLSRKDSVMSLSNLFALKLTCDGLCSQKWIEMLDCDISQYGNINKVLEEVKNSLSIQLEAISSCTSN